MRVRVGDVRLHVEVEGPGLVADGPTLRERPTILLLHGGPGFDQSSLRWSFEPLSDTAQLVYLDHRGQGRSDASSPERWNLDTWIDDVVGLCDVLGLDRPIILGHSFGGMVAQGVAIRHPELPSKLILASTTAKFRTDLALEMFERLGGEEARAVADAYFVAPSVTALERFMEVCYPLYGTTQPDPDVRARIVARPEVGVHFFADEIHTYDFRDELDTIVCPTLVLAGELDPITPVACSQELAARIPQAQLEVVANAGHAPFRDRPEETLGAIRSFVLGGSHPLG
ncbi:MAG TPA: alpha/beta fold hydrolase [Gaiellaceae bacterium]|nr:alpha/beta fold hydrolase [Gaiellaceae bacterium]